MDITNCLDAEIMKLSGELNENAANGKSFASDIAQKYGVTYEQLVSDIIK